MIATHTHTWMHTRVYTPKYIILCGTEQFCKYGDIQWTF